MPWVGFEPKIPASDRAKTVHALDRSATVTGLSHKPVNSITIDIRQLWLSVLPCIELIEGRSKLRGEGVNKEVAHILKWRVTVFELKPCTPGSLEVLNFDSYVLKTIKDMFKSMFFYKNVMY
jgi:hypothetical protein